MTVSELYAYCFKNGIENLDIEIQYRDDGGEYNGTDTKLYLIVAESENVEGKVVLIL